MNRKDRISGDPSNQSKQQGEEDWRIWRIPQVLEDPDRDRVWRAVRRWRSLQELVEDHPPEKTQGLTNGEKT